MGEKSKRKHKFGRLAISIGLALAVLAGAALLIVPHFIPWDKLKNEAVEKLSAVLHHPVSIGAIGFNVFTGIEVKDVRIANAPGFSPEPLLQDDAITIRYRLLPLLIGKVAIKAVILKKPRVRIEKNAAGKFNFSDMLPVSKSPASAAPEPKVAASASKLPSLPLQLLVAQVVVSDATLVYWTAAPQQEYRVEALNLNVDNLTLAGLTPVTLKLAANITALGSVYPLQVTSRWRLDYNQEEFKLDAFQFLLPGLQVDASGRVGKLFSSLEADISGKTSLDLATGLAQDVPADFRKKIPAGLSLQGMAAMTYHIQGSIKNPEVLAVEASHQIKATVGIKGANLPLQLDGQASLQTANAKIKENLTLPGVQAGLVGALQDVFHARQVSATLTGKLTLPEILAKVQALDKTKPALPIQTDGTISLNANLQGALANPENLIFSCLAKLRDIGVTYQDKVLLQKLSADVQLAPQLFTVKQLEADLAGQPLTAAIKAEGFDLRQPGSLKPGQLKAKVDWELKSKMLDVDALLALLPQSAGAPVAPGPAASGPAVPGPVTVSDLPEPDVRAWIPQGITMQGKASLGGLKFSKVTLGRMDYSLDLKHQLLNLAVNLHGYQGQIQSAIQLDFTSRLLGYKVKADVLQVDVEPMLNDLVDTFVAAKLKKPELIAEIKDKFTGSLSGTLNLTGKGLRTLTAKPNLAGKGSFTLKAGRIRQFGFQEDLAKWFGSDKFRQDIPFDHTQVDFELEKQVVNVKKFVAESGLQGESGDIRLTAEGKMSLAAEFDHFKLKPRLSPRAAANLSSEFGQYAEMLKDDLGWVTIPVILNGPVKKPDVQPDWDWIKGQTGNYLRKKAGSAGKEAGQKVQKFVEQQQGKSTKEVQENMSQELEKAKEKLKDLDLKNLFK